MLISDVKIFLAVASLGNFSAAARTLDIGPMQVSRRLGALEEELGVRLFHRSTRSVSVTADGEAFMPYAQALVDAEERARQVLSPASSQVAGVLRLTAPSVFGQAVVLPLLPSLYAQHPGLRVDLDLSDRITDLVGQGFDLALRIAPLADSELVARRIAANPRIICASSAYLAKHGTPRRLADLEQHACIQLNAIPRWPVQVAGELQRLSVSGVFSTSSVDASRAAAMQGLGLAMLTRWDVHQQLQAGTLVEVQLEDVQMEALSVWAVTPSRRLVPARVRVFLDCLEASLAKAVSENGRC